MKFLKHKGYTGSIEFSKEDDLLYGEVLGIESLISYEGKTGGDLETDFEEAIDEYLKDCRDLNREPEKPYKGNFNVRIPSNLHQKAALAARGMSTSLNSFVGEAIRYRLETL